MQPARHEPEPTLKIEVSECKIDPSAGSTATISFEVNADWQTSVKYEEGDQEWLTIAPASGAAGKVDLTVTATGNTQSDARRAYVTITYGGDRSYKLAVVQAGLPDDPDPADPTLKIEVSECTIESAEGSAATVSFEVNNEWQAYVEYEGGYRDWLTIAPASGAAGKVDMTLTAAGNTRFKARRAYVIIYYGGDESYELTVVQSGLPDDTDLTADFDPLFAQMLEERGYIADAKNITPEDVKGIIKLDVSGELVGWSDEVGYEYDGKLTSLRGIEYFESLTNLSCLGNQLTTLDLSNNIALTYLDCQYNQLTTLDISKNTELTVLWCGTNQLTALNVSKNTALTHLSCLGNQLTTLDVSNNTELVDLHCGWNQLSSLDVSNNTALKELVCHSNRLTSLDISNNTALRSLACENNPGDGTVFPVTAWFDNNTVPSEYFTTGSWDYDGATITIDYRKAGTPPSGITADFDPLFAQVLQERGYIADANNITLEEVKGITELDVTSGKLTSLRGIEYFESLTSLNCGDNQLTALDVSNNTALTDLWCYTNQLTALDISKNTALSRLNCGSNQLTSLDVSKNIALTGLACSDNPLTALDVSSNTELKTLNCVDNRLTSLDISKNTALIYLDCHSNRLSSLDVSNNTALIYLACEHNPGDGTVFPVTAWFDNNAIPLGFTAGSWDYDGAAITIDYRQAE